MKMKVAYYTNYGPPEEVIQIKELSKPTPTKDQVLIDIKATTVNRTDCGISSGAYLIMKLITGLRAPKKKILGTDYAGVIEAVGSGVSKYKVGDKVFGFNDEGIESQAEYLALDQKQVHLMPNDLPFEEAVACLEGVHYALNFIDKLNYKAGQKVLVYGATGAIGSAVTQLMKYYGLHVTAVCDTPNMEKIKGLGPDRVIDYKVTDYWKEDVTYDYVCDAVGKSSFSQSKSVLSKKGIYVSSELGKNWENIYLSLFTPLMGGKKVVFPFPRNIERTIKTITKIVDEGKFKPLIDKVYPLDQIVEAYKYTTAGFKVGNVVVKY